MFVKVNVPIVIKLILIFCAVLCITFLEGRRKKFLSKITRYIRLKQIKNWSKFSVIVEISLKILLNDKSIETVAENNKARKGRPIKIKYMPILDTTRPLMIRRGRAVIIFNNTNIKKTDDAIISLFLFAFSQLMLMSSP